VGVSAAPSESLASGPSGFMVSAALVARENAMSMVLKEGSGVRGRDRPYGFVKGVELRVCKWRCVETAELSFLRHSSRNWVRVEDDE
jgi:hypothetical protein